MTKQKLTPLGNRIICELIPKETQTKSGLYIPVQVEDTPSTQTAKVTAIGDDCEYIKKGVTVLLQNQYVGAIVDDVTRVIKEDEVLAIVN